MVQVSKPIVKVDYQGVNITEDISGFLMEVMYKDNVHGKADEIELTLDDSLGLFIGAWYPDKKARLRVQIFHEGRELNCGTFYIGEVTYNFPPDLVTWHGTSIDPSLKLRTKKSKSYNQVTLLQIAKDIAANHGLRVDDGTKTVKTPYPKTEEEQKTLVKLAELFLRFSNEPNTVFFYYQMSALQMQLLNVIQSLEDKGYKEQATQLRSGVGGFLTDTSSLEATASSSANTTQKTRLGASRMSALITQVKTGLRLAPTQHTRTLSLGLSKIMVEHSTQNNKTDLEYLKELAVRYGLAFNIKPPYLVFYSAFHLSAAPSSVTLHKSQVISGDISDKTQGTYSDVMVSHHNPNENDTISNTRELQNTALEQQQLLFLFRYMSQAALQDYGTRLAFIRKASETNNKILVSLSRKGFGEEYEALLAAYSLLYADKSVTACVRFANVCQELRGKLLKIQAAGNKLPKEKDSYAGGQSGNTLVLKTSLDNKEQADAVAKAALYKANSETRTGSVTVPGNLLLVAGNNFEFQGIGRLSQKYNIVSSTHLITNGGEYTTAIEFKAGPVVKS
jgi:phage protein D